MAANNSQQRPPSHIYFSEIDGAKSQPLQIWQAEAVLVLKSKLEDRDVYKRWLDATLPHLGEFLRSSAGWSGKIIIHDEAGTILEELTHRETDQIKHEINLVRSPDGKFRLKSSPTFKIEPRVTTLFSALEAQLTADGFKPSADLLLYSFDYCLENDNPGMGKKLDGILSKSAPA